MGETLSMEGQPPFTVGIVAEVRHSGLTQTDNDLYVPYRGAGHLFVRTQVLVKTESAAPNILAMVREDVWAVEPDLPVPAVVPMENLVSRPLAARRFLSALLGSFATHATLLAATGLYSTMLYSVSSRLRALGLRIAMGARASDVVGLVLRQGLVLTGLGVGLGLSGATILSRVLRGLASNVGPMDPVTVASVAGVLVAVSIAACVLPARRAASVDPVQMMRVE